MVRLNPGTTLLAMANLAVFFAFGAIGFDGDIAAVRHERVELQQKLPQLKEQYEWMSKAMACIINPPQTDAGKLLSKLNQMAGRLGADITEAAQNNGQTPEIKLAGSGEFNNISVILNSVAAEKAAVVKRIRLEQTDKSIWEFETDVAVRSGPWEYFPTQERNPVPEILTTSVSSINSGKPFSVKAARAKAPVIKELIHYIGYFSEQKIPAVIIEYSGKFAILKCGETTPGGSVIKQASAEELQLGKKDDSGKETVWTVKMEKK